MSRAEAAPAVAEDGPLRGRDGDEGPHQKPPYGAAHLPLQHRGRPAFDEKFEEDPCQCKMPQGGQEGELL